MIMTIEDKLQQFVDLLPVNQLKKYRSLLPTATYIPMYEDDFMRHWSEHDAIHFLTGLHFGMDDEIKVAKIELELNCGWSPLGYKYNTLSEPKYQENLRYDIPNTITLDTIKQTAEDISHLL